MAIDIYRYLQAMMLSRGITAAELLWIALVALFFITHCDRTRWSAAAIVRLA